MRDRVALTALLIPVPVAEQVVRGHRERLDPSAVWGVPAHITVLFPFLSPPLVSATVVDRIEEVLTPVTPIGFTLERTAWFGDQVLWLAPHPADPFVRLIEAVCAAFPECEPYGGAFGDVVPHVTVGDRAGGATLADLLAAERAVSRRLPLPATADTVLLMAGGREPKSWETRHTFTLTASH